MAGYSMNAALRGLNGARVENVTGKESDFAGQLQYPGEIRRYILGGNSCFTLRNQASGSRFTYKVKSATKERDSNWSTNNQDKSTYFVSVKTGPGDSYQDYTYLGMLKQSPDGPYNFQSTKGSRISMDAASFQVFLKVWNLLEFGCRWPSGVEFFHEGICCVCGRKLTVPESVAAGIGPECAGKE